MMLVLGGCAGKGIEFRLDIDSDTCGTKKVVFSTDYQVKGLSIERTIEGGGTGGNGGSEGCGGGYTIILDEGTTKDAQTGMMLEMFRMIMTLIPGAEIPVPLLDEN